MHILIMFAWEFCRHFGGTKLGTGGLARAYGGAARECLQLAEKETFQRQASVSMQVNLDQPTVCDVTGLARLFSGAQASGSSLHKGSMYL